MEKLLLRQVAPLRPSGLPAWAALLFGLALSFWASQGIRENILAAEEARFLLHVQRAETAMRRQLWLYEQPLRAAAVLFKADAVITPDAWRRHASGFLADTNLPAVRSMGYATYGMANDAPGGEPVPRARVLFTTPASAPPEQGFDLLVHSGIRSVLFHARDTDDAALSRRLDDGTGSSAHLFMAWPVYLDSPPPGNADEHRRMLLGWTFAFLDAIAVLRDALRDQDPNIGVVIHDGPVVSASTHIYGEPDATEDTRLSANRVLEHYGRSWTLHYFARPAFMQGKALWQANLVGIGGAVISLLLFLILRDFAQAHGHTHSRAEVASHALPNSQAQVPERGQQLARAQTVGCIAYWELGLSDHALCVTDKFCDLMNLPEGLAGQELFQLAMDRVHPEDRRDVAAAIRRAREDGLPINLEFRIPLSNQRLRHMHCQAEVECDPQGKPDRLSGFLLDITTRKHAEQLQFALNTQLEKRLHEVKEARAQLAETRRELCDILDTVPDIIYLLDTEFRLVRWNRSVETLTGRTPQDLLGIPATDLLHPDDRTEALAAVARCLEVGHAEAELHVLDKDGRAIPYCFNGAVRRDASGTVIGIAGVGSDISERKKTEAEIVAHRDRLQELVEERTVELVAAKERAEASSQAKSQFLANISHELRTPMHAILSFTRLGRAKSAADIMQPDRIVHYFERIEQSGQRLLNLVNDLLDLSRLESGRMTCDLKPTRFDSIVREVAQELTPMLTQKGLRLDMLFPDQPAQLHCDPLRIGQLIRNLLANAIKFTPEGRGIHIAVEPEQVPGRRHDDAPQAGWRLTVSDEGVGIPENELEAVFDKFVQSSKTPSGAGGTGLGLAICREIVQAHHGQIRAENNPEGGARLVVLLPATFHPHVHRARP